MFGFWCFFVFLPTVSLLERDERSVFDLESGGGAGIIGGKLDVESVGAQRLS